MVKQSKVQWYQIDILKSFLSDVGVVIPPGSCGAASLIESCIPYLRSPRRLERKIDHIRRMVDTDIVSATTYVIQLISRVKWDETNVQPLVSLPQPGAAQSKSEDTGESPDSVVRANLSFYSSRAWKDLRPLVFNKYGYLCMKCRKTPSDGVILHIDHIIPRSIFPSLSLDIDNLQVLCGPCNSSKSNRDFSDYRESYLEPLPPPAKFKFKPAVFVRKRKES